MKIRYPIALLVGLSMCVVAIIATIPAIHKTAVYQINPVYTFFAGMVVIGFSFEVEE